MLVSGGQLVTKTPTFPFTPATSSSWFYNSERAWRAGHYGQMYARQLWVYVLIRKRGLGTARLPLKTYQRDDQNRPPATGAYADLIANPNPAISPFRFWEWTSCTYDTYGEAFWLKVRPGAGLPPTSLAPLHPVGMTLQPDGRWDFANEKIQLRGIERDDLVHFKTFNPADPARGLSPLEPLRDTLENEGFARTATSSFWRNGARPGVALKHPKNLSTDAANRLKAQWNAAAQGPGNTGTTVVLEEGLEPMVLTLSAEEAQYIETRKLNREEACAAYDVPPPVVHILDRATFSNITEQMRSMYRDTMAPHLKGFESDMHQQLCRPDFGDDQYAEFLLDEVLRGDFEARAAAYDKADYMTMAEKRRAENLPYIEGTDKIFVNAATVPLDEASRSRTPQAVTDQQAQPVEDQDDDGAGKATPRELVEMIQKIYLGVGTVLTEDEARALLNRAGAGLAPGAGPNGAPPAAPAAVPAAQQVSPETVRSLMGRLSWQKRLDQVNTGALVEGLNGDRDAVLVGLAFAQAAGDDVPGLKSRFRAMVKAR